MSKGSKVIVVVAILVASATSLACGAVKRTTAARRVSAHGGDARTDFRPTAWEAFSPAVEAPRRRVVQSLLCAATKPEACEGSCMSLAPHDAAHCALDLAYADDPDARVLARDLLELTGAVPGVEQGQRIDAGYLGFVPIEPTLPIGPYRQHLVWLRDGILAIERVFAAAAQAAPKPVLFRTRPYGFRFFKTEERTYPSAYAIEGIVGYNLEGPLHDSQENVTATLFHELFHLNDEARGQWSQSALGGLLEQVVATCEDDHACFARFAPTDDRVPDGTYYPFDARTRDVREYAAEIALRWFREQRTLLEGATLAAPPFKCGADENAQAWQAIVEEFFGGLDLTGECT